MTLKVVILLVIVLVSYATALQCFDCNSALNRNLSCQTNVNTGYVLNVNCSTAQHCLTYVMNDRVGRRCGNSTECEGMKFSPEYVSCTACNYNLCNNENVGGANVFELSLVTLCLSLILNTVFSTKFVF